MINFETQMHTDVQVISLIGSLDAITAEEATSYLDEQITAPQVVLDMSNLEYISSAGVRVLLGVIKSARSSGGDLRLAKLSGMVLDTLEMAGITSIAKFYDEVDSAVTSFDN